MVMLESSVPNSSHRTSRSLIRTTMSPACACVRVYVCAHARAYIRTIRSAGPPPTNTHHTHHTRMHTGEPTQVRPPRPAPQHARVCVCVHAHVRGCAPVYICVLHPHHVCMSSLSPPFIEDYAHSSTSSVCPLQMRACARGGRVVAARDGVEGVGGIEAWERVEQGT